MKRLRIVAIASVASNILVASAFLFPIFRQNRPTFCATLPLAFSQSTILLQGSDNAIHQSESNVTDVLWSYAYNIPKASRQDDATQKERMRPVYSFVYFLQQNKANNDNVQEPFERATIQAIRAASTAGDFRLILRILEATMHFLSRVPPRIFGEAIESLSRTSCNVSKLKQVWKLAKNSNVDLGAFELNTMLRALASRGKIRAVLDLYEQERSLITTDAYTSSTILTALSSSIIDDQAVANGKWSPCWQYNAARELLEEAPVNNYVFAAAFRLNERAGQVFSTQTQRHYTAKAAMDLLQLMKNRNVSPDVVTCSLVTSTFDKARQSNAAIALLDAMTRNTTSLSTWTLPAPNEYIYSSVISACARCHDYDGAMQVLKRMRNDYTCYLNTLVYNAALKACRPTRSSRKQRTQKCQMALTLLRDMQQDAKRGMNTAPDTVSYNSVLAVLGGYGAPFIENEHFSFSPDGESSRQESLVLDLMEQMKEISVPRDALTYRNAIRAVGINENAVLALLSDAVSDLEADELIAVFNTALAVSSSGDNLHAVESVFSEMVESHVKPNSETFIHLLNALGSTGYSEFILNALLALHCGDTESLDTIKEYCGIDLKKLFPIDSKVSLELKHYSAAINSCLAANDIDNALQVLSLMREDSLSPDEESLQEIALTYCRLATLASAEESKIGRRVRSKKKTKRTLGMDVKRRVSAARARSALDITLSLQNPSTYLLSTVSKACCSAGMWTEGRLMLGRVHNAAVTEDTERRSDPKIMLPGLHRSLLKLCASKGNATAALGFVDDIQALSKTLTSSSTNNTSIRDDTFSLSSLFDNASCLDDDADVDDVAALISEAPDMIIHGDIGMKGEDWKLLLIAASKAGNWRLCLGTLQFLRPYLEATHPRNKGDSDTRKQQFKRYDKLARSLTAAIFCFEMRGQYAWALRAIDDWMEWSGRRPRKEAILGAFRILASRGQGYEVNRLLKQVLHVPATSFDDSQAASYEEILCVGALNSLHSHGLYEDADDLYVEACTQGYLPFSIETVDASSNSPIVLDLHGMNVAMANSAVRIALQQYALPTSQDGDMIIVTGRGMRSAQRLRPVLRPEVQRMLLEEFYPPINTVSVPGNLGALKVPCDDITTWVAEQRQQKGARMLAIANVLKNLTSGERIRKSIELKMQASDGNNDDESKQV